MILVPRQTSRSASTISIFSDHRSALGDCSRPGAVDLAAVIFLNPPLSTQPPALATSTDAARDKLHSVL